MYYFFRARRNCVIKVSYLTFEKYVGHLKQQDRHHQNPARPQSVPKMDDGGEMIKASEIEFSESDTSGIH
jgi:hypothetical protein